MSDRGVPGLQYAVVKMGAILLGAPCALATLHEGPWYGLNPDRI